MNLAQLGGHGIWGPMRAHSSHVPIDGSGSKNHLHRRANVSTTGDKTTWGNDAAVHHLQNLEDVDDLDAKKKMDCLQS